jgi:hypothetical protein
VIVLFSAGAVGLYCFLRQKKAKASEDTNYQQLDDADFKFTYKTT